MVLYPYISILQPILIWLVFMVYYVYLSFFAQKEIAQSNKESTGIVISGLMFASLIVWIIYLTGAYTMNIRHYPWLSDDTKLCGPFEDNTNYQKHLETAFRLSPALSWIYGEGGFLMSYPVVILIVLFLTAYAVLNFNREAIENSGVVGRVAVYKKEIAYLTRLTQNK